MSHVPWTGYFYVKIPGVGRGLKAFRSYAIQRATIRKAQGSQNKDIFYHLVCRDDLNLLPPSTL